MAGNLVIEDLIDPSRVWVIFMPGGANHYAIITLPETKRLESVGLENSNGLEDDSFQISFLAAFWPILRSAIVG